MPDEPLLFITQQAGTDPLAGSSRLSVNLMPAVDGNFRLRPGLTTTSIFPATVPAVEAVVGMVIFRNDLVYVTRDAADIGRVYVIKFDGVVTPLSDASPLTQVQGTERPRITTTRDRVIIAGGGEIQQWDGSPLSSRLGGPPPPNVLDVDVISQRIIAMPAGEGGLYFWSGAGDGNHETWNLGVDFREAESRPDKLVAIRATSRELFAFGSESLEVHSPDPNEVFTNTNTVDIGCISRHSVVRIDDIMHFLADRRRFVSSNGRDIEYIGTPATDRALQELTTVTDCWGTRIRLDDRDFVLWVFPTDGRAFVYDINIKVWGEWRGWDDGQWKPLAIQSHVYWPERNVNLVGLSNGAIVELTLDSFTDLDLPISFQAITGSRSHGTSSLKETKRVQFVVTRGASTDPSPAFYLQWSDDPQRGFSDPLKLSVDKAEPGQLSIHDLWTVGKPYVQRAWRLFGGSDALTSVSRATETVTVNEES